MKADIIAGIIRGNFSIVTSELGMSDREMREVYRGLARIKDSFKATKTHFETQPVYVWLNEHIDAHFAACFLALVPIRLLENKLGYTFHVGRILDALCSYNCVHLDRNLWKFTYKFFLVKIVSKKPYRQKGSSPHIYWVRAYFTSELEITIPRIHQLRFLLPGSPLYKNCMRR